MYIQYIQEDGVGVVLGDHRECLKCDVRGCQGDVICVGFISEFGVKEAFFDIVHGLHAACEDHLVFVRKHHITR